MSKVLQVPQVAFDESGNTGANLLDDDQPVFVLASVLCTDAVRALATGSGEMKFSKLRKSAKGRAEILRVLNDEALSTDSYVVSGMHKRFMIVTKIVDLLYEPFVHAAGIDLYARGANLAFSNLLYFTLPTFIGEDRYRALQERFVPMVRDPTDEHVDAFFGVVRAAYDAAAEDGMKSELAVLLASRVVVDAQRESFDSTSLDPAVPSFFLHASEWTGRLGVPFDVLHDASKPIENEQLVLEAMMSVDEPSRQIGYDRRKAHFPLASTGIVLQDSAAEPAIQIADVIASAIAYVLRETLKKDRSDFAEELFTTRVLQGTWAPVWPKLKVTPQELETDEAPPSVDPHELMGDYVSERLGGIPPVGQRRKPRG